MGPIISFLLILFSIILIISGGCLLVYELNKHPIKFEQFGPWGRASGGFGYRRRYFPYGYGNYWYPYYRRRFYYPYYAYYPFAYGW